MDDGKGKGKPNPNSELVWEFVKRGDDEGDRMNYTMCSVAIHNSLVIAPDASGFVHCLDAETGKKYWTHDCLSSVWASPLIVDDKVYVADEDGDVMIFQLAKQKKLLASQFCGSSLDSSPVFANGVLYVMARGRLYAIKQQK